MAKPPAKPRATRPAAKKATAKKKVAKKSVTAKPAAEQPKYPAPTGLTKSKLWSGITDKYDLRPDELRVLEEACREADLIDSMVVGMRARPLMVKGSMGQPTVNPLLSEIRLHRQTLAALMRQLDLPDDPAGEGAGKGSGPGSRSSAARNLANARWSRRGS